MSGWGIIFSDGTFIASCEGSFAPPKSLYGECPQTLCWLTIAHRWNVVLVSLNYLYFILEWTVWRSKKGKGLNQFQRAIPRYSLTIVSKSAGSRDDEPTELYACCTRQCLRASSSIFVDTQHSWNTYETGHYRTFPKARMFQSMSKPVRWKCSRNSFKGGHNTGARKKVGRRASPNLLVVTLPAERCPRDACVNDQSEVDSFTVHSLDSRGVAITRQLGVSGPAVTASKPWRLLV